MKLTKLRTQSQIRGTQNSPGLMNNINCFDRLFENRSILFHALLFKQDDHSYVFLFYSRTSLFQPKNSIN